MRLFQIGLMSAVLCPGIAESLDAAEKSNVGELTRELKGEKLAAERTPEQREAAYAEVLGALMSDLGHEDPSKRGNAQGTLERIVFHAGRPGAEADRAACSKAAAARLGPEAASPARVWLLRQIERIGRAEVVPQVAALLAEKDPPVRDAARRALLKNPAAEANAALQAAVGSADAPAWRVAILNALAERRDPSNLGLFRKEAASDHDDVRSAAVVGLARLGDKSAAAPIAAAMNQGTPAARRIAADARLLLADALVAKGDKAAAIDIYKSMLASEGHVRCAALIGVGRAGGAGDLPILLEALADADARVRGAGAEALARLGGKDVTGAIAAQVATAKTEAKRALLMALAWRGDPGAAAVFMAAADDADDGIRAAALTGLGAIGGPAAAPALVKAAAAGGKLQETARQSLLVLPGADVDPALLGAVTQPDAKGRAEVVRALASRHVVAAIPAILKAAEDADAGVRNEALKALGVMAPTSALPAVAAILLKAEEESTRNEAAAALTNIAIRDQDVEGRSEPILKAIASSRGAAKLSFLAILGRIGGQRSLACVTAALQDQDEKVKDAAVRALAEWPDAAAAEALLAVATSAAGETHQVLAIRGYLRVCRIRTKRPEAETARMLAAGLAAAKRPEEKRQALGGLADVRDLSALHAIETCLNNPAVKEESAAAAIRVARGLVNSNPEAVKVALQNVLKVTASASLQKEAQDVIDRAEKEIANPKPKK